MMGSEEKGSKSPAKKKETAPKVAKYDPKKDPGGLANSE